MGRRVVGSHKQELVCEHLGEMFQMQTALFGAFASLDFKEACAGCVWLETLPFDRIIHMGGP